MSRLPGFKALTHVMLTGLALLFITACGGGGGGGGPTLAGSWFGTLERDDGTLTEMTVTIDGGGNITSISTAFGITGTTAPSQGPTPPEGQLFGFTLSDGTEGGFFVDPGFIHAVFVDEDFNFGVLTKGATNLPTFSEQDLVGSYNGQTVGVDPSFDVTFVSPSTAQVFPDGSFGESGELFGVIPAFSSEFGAYLLDFDDPDLSGIVILSADRNFAGAYDCDRNLSFPEACVFSAWTKN